jgi:hypothetical protein
MHSARRRRSDTGIEDAANLARATIQIKVGRNPFLFRTQRGSVTASKAIRLLNVHLSGQIDEIEFSAKNTEIRDRIAQYTLQLEAADRSSDEHADLARKAFELSQSLPERWLTADYSTKRQILEIVCLNFSLDGVTLVPEWRKPFDVLVEGLVVSSSRGDKI